MFNQVKNQVSIYKSVVLRRKHVHNWRESPRVDSPKIFFSHGLDRRILASLPKTNFSIKTPSATTFRLISFQVVGLHVQRLGPEVERGRFRAARRRETAEVSGRRRRADRNGGPDQRGRAFVPFETRRNESGEEKNKTEGAAEGVQRKRAGRRGRGEGSRQVQLRLSPAQCYTIQVLNPSN